MSFWQISYPDPVCSQFQVPQFGQPIKPLNLLYLVLHKVDIPELLEVIHILDMLDLVEAEIQACKIYEAPQSFHV